MATRLEMRVFDPMKEIRMNICEKQNKGLRTMVAYIARKLRREEMRKNKVIKKRGQRLETGDGGGRREEGQKSCRCWGGTNWSCGRGLQEIIAQDQLLR